MDTALLMDRYGCIGDGCDAVLGSARGDLGTGIRSRMPWFRRIKIIFLVPIYFLSYSP